MGAGQRIIFFEKGRVFLKLKRKIMFRIVKELMFISFLTTLAVSLLQAKCSNML